MMFAPRLSPIVETAVTSATCARSVSIRRQEGILPSMRRRAPPDSDRSKADSRPLTPDGMQSQDLFPRVSPPKSFEADDSNPIAPKASLRFSSPGDLFNLRVRGFVRARAFLRAKLKRSFSFTMIFKLFFLSVRI